MQPCSISSANGLAAIERVMREIQGGAETLEAVVAGVSLVEDDPSDMSVGYGGLPNEAGVVQLDAAVMHGPTHESGAVAALCNIRNPSQVALAVMRRTDHVLLAGQGALEFARAMGFKEQDLLTDQAREAWLKWKAHADPNDDWLDDDQRARPVGRGPGGGAPPEDIPFTDGTIHVSAVDGSGDLSACTSTSGRSYKLPGRVGDSPIVGAGLFVDNEIGSAGSTGRGEAVIESAASFQVVRHMGQGIEPTEACLRILRSIAGRTRRRYLRDDHGRPNFQVTMYALRKDGAYGSACMHKGKSFAVHDGKAARTEPCAYLFE